MLWAARRLFANLHVRLPVLAVDSVGIRARNKCRLASKISNSYSTRLASYIRAHEEIGRCPTSWRHAAIVAEHRRHCAAFLATRRHEYCREVAHRGREIVIVWQHGAVRARK